MPIVSGFNEEYGDSIKKTNYIELKLMSVAYKYCYKEIKIPIIEYFSSFDEKIVGKSPWPGWNCKGIFNFEIKNYFSSYSEKPKSENVLLIPEGTTSVTRWLGDKINNNDYTFPMKIFYNLNCYRNELISTLSEDKKREFKQFGYEILGSNSIQSDCEMLSVLFDSLRCIGIDNTKIRVRINNIAIYKMLCDETGINEDATIILKEKLDYLAECKAGKHSEKYQVIYNEILDFILKYSNNDRVINKWLLVMNDNSGNIGKKFDKIFGSKYIKLFDELRELKNEFKNQGMNLFIDLCVIRSHEYYTGIAFEVDVLYANKKYIEIAGGGRFDRLVSNFINKTDGKTFIVPCTGFAFGTHRVVKMLNELGLLDNMENLELCFKDNSEIIYPKDERISSYFEELNKLKDGNFINIFVGKI